MQNPDIPPVTVQLGDVFGILQILDGADPGQSLRLQATRMQKLPPTLLRKDALQFVRDHSVDGVEVVLPSILISDIERVLDLPALAILRQCTEEVAQVRRDLAEVWRNRYGEPGRIERMWEWCRRGGNPIKVTLSFLLFPCILRNISQRKKLIDLDALAGLMRASLIAALFLDGEHVPGNSTREAFSRLEDMKTQVRTLIDRWGGKRD